MRIIMETNNWNQETEFVKNEKDNYTTKLHKVYTSTNYIYLYHIKEDETTAVCSMLIWGEI